VLQKLYRRRPFCTRLVTLICSASLVECALAQHPDTNASDAGPATSVAVVASHPGNDRFSAARTEALSERTSLQMIAPQAQAHIDYALNLAERGAVQSAQAEFTMALDLIADAVDSDTKNTTRAHARAVQAGLIAIAETKDFVPADTPHNVVINLAQLAATHQTPVLKDIDVSRMTRAEALQRYHTYATQQLAFAGGRSAIASAALYGLGRSECVTTAGASSRNPLGAPNAMALYQAALLVDPQNYMASNELGVLMARYGDLDSAANQLTHSLSIKPQVETWHNLAAVYRRMGQAEKAEQAEREREKLQTAPRTTVASAKDSTDLGARTPVQWVDTDAFAATATPDGLDGPAANSNKAKSIAPNDSLGKRLIARLNPWAKTDKPQQNTDSTQLSQKTDPSRGSEPNSRTLFK
jgi:tetratricopeptide (TPR) repeat protein